MINDEFDDEVDYEGRCENCGIEADDSELLPYEEIKVCNACLDELRLDDERDSLEIELEDYEEWE